jgi:hypothetical protein
MTDQELLKIARTAYPAMGWDLADDANTVEVRAGVLRMLRAVMDTCAELAEGATAYTQFQTVEHYKIAAFIAAALRERPNVKLTGSAQLNT